MRHYAGSCLWLEFLETYADRLFFATDMVNTEMVFPLGQWLDEQAANGALSAGPMKKSALKMPRQSLDCKKTCC